jgi:hypothetical protein
VKHFDVEDMRKVLDENGNLKYESPKRNLSFYCSDEVPEDIWRTSDFKGWLPRRWRVYNFESSTPKCQTCKDNTVWCMDVRDKRDLHKNPHHSNYERIFCKNCHTDRSTVKRSEILAKEKAETFMKCEHNWTPIENDEKNVFERKICVKCDLVVQKLLACAGCNRYRVCDCTTESFFRDLGDAFPAYHGWEEAIEIIVDEKLPCHYEKRTLTKDLIRHMLKKTKKSTQIAKVKVMLQKMLKLADQKEAELAKSEVD